MEAFAGRSGVYPIPHFRVVVDGGLELDVFAESSERARDIIMSMYGRETRSVTPVDPPLPNHPR